MSPTTSADGEGSDGESTGTTIRSRLLDRYRGIREAASLGWTLTKLAVSLIPRMWRDRDNLRDGFEVAQLSTKLLEASSNCPSCAEYAGMELCSTHEAANARVNSAIMNADYDAVYGLEAALATHPDEAGILVDPRDPDVDRSNLFLGGVLLMSHEAYDSDASVTPDELAEALSADSGADEPLLARGAEPEPEPESEPETSPPDFDLTVDRPIESTIDSGISFGYPSTWTDSGEHIISGSMWRHTVTGNYFLVIAPDSADLDEHDPRYIGSPSEPFVFCYALNYETRGEVHLARRLFDSQLERIYATDAAVERELEKLGVGGEA